ncbi:MAG: histidine kinase [Bacteroidetes bacterium]|nr:histidine kinase [Bacteroidota bacterium]
MMMNRFKLRNVLQFLLANAILALIILAVFFGNILSNPERFLSGYLWSFTICITQWAGPIMIKIILEKRLKWIDRPVTRTFVEIFSLLLWSVFAFISVQFLMYYLVRGILPAAAWLSIEKSIIYTFLISLFISLTFTAIGFFKAWRQSVLKEAELKSEMMAYKYNALRSQINPHFLFNSFNVLSDLVYEDQKQAVRFIRQMSELFRYVLDSRDKELVTLGEELEFMNSYAGLLKTRFGDKLELNINLPQGKDQLIVPMTLQLLIENAVKHNEVSVSKPLKVELRQIGIYLEVENVLQPKEILEESKNTGLKNIIQQFSFFTDHKVDVINNGLTFKVRIPLIQQIENESNHH